MRAQSGDVVLELQSVRVGLAPELVFESQSSTPHVIRRGWLTVATTFPCHGGAGIRHIAVDDGGADGLLPAGSHTLRLDFDDNLRGYSLDVVVDLETADGSCIRAPALSQQSAMEPVPRLLLVIGGGAMGNAPLAGAQTIADFRAGVGRTLGPVLVTAELGAGTTQCAASICGKKDNDTFQTAAALMASVSARRGWAIPGRFARGNFVTLGARYAFATTRLPPPADERRLSLHIVQGMLGWAIGVGFEGPFRHRERTLGLEFGVPLGVMFEQASPGHVVFIGGIELRFLIDV